MKVKRLLTFVIGAAVLQGLLLLFCTQGGLMLLYPYVVRMAAEDYQPRGTSTVYYDMRLDVTDAPLFVVGMDPDVAQSYDAFVHLFRFLKQYSGIQTIYLVDNAAYADAIAARMADPLVDHGLPETLLSFADALSSLNETQPPAKKFTVAAWQENAYADMAPGTALLLMERDRMMAERAQNLDDTTLYIEMKYVNCQTNDGVRTDMTLPFVGETTAYAFLPASRIDWFYRYYEKVADPLQLGRDTTGLQRTAAPYVIFVENGQAAVLETIGNALA